jgi:hypothetical protein
MVADSMGVAAISRIFKQIPIVEGKNKGKQSTNHDVRIKDLFQIGVLIQQWHWEIP